MPRKHPLPKREIEITRRLKQVRVASRCPRRYLAYTLGFDDAGIVARMELGRAPLRYAFAQALIEFLNINPLWLSTGEGDMRGSVSLPLPEELKVGADALYSTVFDAYLAKYFDGNGAATFPKSGQGETDAIADYRRFNLESDLREELTEILDGLTEEVFPAFMMELKESAVKLAAKSPKDRWDKVIQRRKRREGTKRNPLAFESEAVNYQLTGVSLKSKRVLVKSEIKSLIRDVKQKASQPGAKSELAGMLGVAPARISEWLSGKKEPGGEYALRLANWVYGPRRK